MEGMTGFLVNPNSLFSDILAVMIPKSGHCTIHGAYTVLTHKDHEPVCVDCQAKLMAQQDAERIQQMKASREQEIMRRRIGSSGIPPRFIERTIEGFVAETKEQRRCKLAMRAYVDKFDTMHQRGTSLIFTGGHGTAKTHLGCAVVRELLMRGWKAAYIEAYRMIRNIKSHYQTGRDEQAAIDSYVNPVDLLVIDEAMAVRGSETDQLILFEVINGRYAQQVPTILICNVPESDLAAFFGEPMVDRLHENGGVTFPFDWESYRGRCK